MADEKALEVKKPEDIIRYQPGAEKLIQRGLKELQRRSFEPEMILIPAGEFLMGSDPRKDKYAEEREQPQHTLYLPDYYLAKTPVTNAQYAAFVQATGHRQPDHWAGGKPPGGKEDHPVVWVTWYDAMAYCSWLAEVTGKPYCLPSEAEWEKGARGSDGRIYPWGNQWDAWRCGILKGGKRGTTPVGAYPEGASPYGLLDMAGNVWEWTRSLWGASFVYPYDPADGREDLDAPGGAPRVLRGGAFLVSRWLVRCAYRDRDSPGNFIWHYGFRVVVSPGSPLGVKGEEKPAVVKKPEPVRPPCQALLHDTLPEPEMILIPAGEFLMGSDPTKDKDAEEIEQPQHTLYLPDYYLAKTPVTNAQYAAFVQATGHRQPKFWKGGKPPRGKEDHPVVNVSWYDAMAYCRWLSEATGKPYCLPSEAEWEKGARGNDGRIYPWGNRWDAKRCNSEEGGKGDTTPVGAYPRGASPYGLLDMAGNVWEWTRNLWGGESWKKPSFKYPYDPSDGREDLDAPPSAVLRALRDADPGVVLRVLRGGAFVNDRRYVRCAFRPEPIPFYRPRLIGFRVVVSPGSPLGSGTCGGGR